MAIDFHDPRNAGTYSTREADDSWRRAITRLVDPAGLRAVDIGCGGGIYSTALAQMGATQVIGIDSSAQMVNDARQRAEAAGIPTITFRQGSAVRTGIPDGGADLVLHRALIHHLADPAVAFAEVHRILGPGGTLLVQDRTMADVMVPASTQHLRGWFFELFPRLLDVEATRRPRSDDVDAWLGQAGLAAVEHHRLSERRRTYENLEELNADLRARTGRSILHELTDEELSRLADEICDRIASTIGDDGAIHEIDHWTVWEARRDNKQALT
ncbi:methyltransferase domain-containing protein [Cellulosimicrobium funkei]|nr:methyltransferase domain-containing protein [Cellulosimicrobium funkei]